MTPNLTVRLAWLMTERETERERGREREQERERKKEREREREGERERERERCSNQIAWLSTRPCASTPFQYIKHARI